VATNVVLNVARPRDELSGGEGEIGHRHQENSTVAERESAVRRRANEACCPDAQTGREQREDYKEGIFHERSRFRNHPPYVCDGDRPEDHAGDPEVRFHDEFSVWEGSINGAGFSAPNPRSIVVIRRAITEAHCEQQEQ
jgi:hypothetical protein